MGNLELSSAAIYFFIAVFVWTIPWKGVALWRAAKNGQNAWFVLILIFNTLAILEIIYIFIFSKNKNKTAQLGQN